MNLLFGTKHENYFEKIRIFVIHRAMLSIIIPTLNEEKYLPLLLEEIKPFPNVPIISLGQPLLSAMVKSNASAFVRDYWGYKVNWKSGEGGTYRYLKPELNKTGRIIFPFPHQPSLNKEFYRNRLAEYIYFIKGILLSKEK